LLQRVLDAYHGFTESERSEVDALMARCGGNEAMQIAIPQRLERLDNRLELIAPS
jgi:hypothetical protein